MKMATPPTKSDKDLAAQRNELTSRPLAAIRMSATLDWSDQGVRSTLPGEGSAAHVGNSRRWESLNRVSEVTIWTWYFRELITAVTQQRSIVTRWALQNLLPIRLWHVRLSLWGHICARTFIVWLRMSLVWYVRSYGKMTENLKLSRSETSLNLINGQLTIVWSYPYICK